MGLLQNLEWICSISAELEWGGLAWQSTQFPGVVCSFLSSLLLPSNSWEWCFQDACHVPLLVPWEREEEVVEHHGGLEGVNFTHFPLYCFIPWGKRRRIDIFPQEKRNISVRKQGMCFCWLYMLLVWLHEADYLIPFFPFPHSWRDLLWQIHWIHLPSRGDLRAPQGLHDLGLYLHWSWTWENQLHYCQYVTKSLFLELLFLSVIFSRVIYMIFPVPISYSCMGFNPKPTKALKLKVLAPPT